MRSFLTAVAFLTRFPVPGASTFDAADVARSASWFPFVGLLLGSVYSLVAVFLKMHLPDLVIAVLLIVIDALCTGALHFDGLADTADGFGGGKDLADILRIMRDHAIGSYGGMALALIVALKVTAYDSLLKQSDFIPAVILTPALGRWSILLLTGALPYARSSASAIQGMGIKSLMFGTCLVLVPMILASLMRARFVRGWIAMGVVILVSVVFGFYCKRRIGGVTGDTLGANLQICESAALLTYILTWSR